jgi:elongation factor Tu
MQLILGLRMADAVVLFVGAEGFTPESKKHIMLAEAAGVQRVIIFAEGGNNSSPIEKRDLESVLVGTGFKPQDIPIVVGKVSSDVNGAVADLLEKLEPLVNRRLTASDRSFLLPIDDVFSIQGRGIVVTGMVERGLLRVGETVELLGVGQRLSVTCRGIEIFRGTLTVAHPGDCVGILLQGVERSQVSAGMVLASPRSVDLASRFRGRLCLLSNGNAGLRVPSTEKQDVELLIRTASVKAKATVLPVRANEANGQVSVEFTLAQSTPLEEGMWFAMVVDEQLAATGSVEEILGVRGEGVK